MKRWCFILGIVAAFTLQHTAKAVAQEPQLNLIKEEMIAMNDAFTNLIQALIFNKPDVIEGPFLKVKEARKKIEEAIKKGEKIILPKNHSKFKEFMKLDEEYHAELEKLLAAAKDKNMKIIKLQTHKLLNFCVYCHARFR
ncbi:MAG: cytochrome c [Deltaproteobacteria bacterium]|nr:cytochrome c [Deltaproteobacteria bacterium]